MSWSSWGLNPLDDGTSARAVLGGGRVVTLAVDERRTTVVDQLSRRWSVSSVEVGATAAVTPQPGDIVVRRGTRRRGLNSRFLRSGPTRVLSAAVGDRPDTVKLCCLEDATLSEADESSFDTDWLAGLLDRDRVLRSDEEWDLLALWRLRPQCPRCGADTRTIVYGLPAGIAADEADDFVFAGCVIPQEQPRHQCSRCGHEFSMSSPSPMW